MSQRLQARFHALAEAKRAGLVTYVMAGHPTLEVSREALLALPGAGADIIELGLPFSDPMADGPVIEAAAERALAEQVKVADVLALVRDFRMHHAATPLLLMGYYNVVLHYGLQAFVRDAADAGVDGLLLVDLPPEESAELEAVLDEVGMVLIRLSAPTTDAARAAKILPDAKGFVYHVAIAGVTGSALGDMAPVEEKVQMLRRYAKVPIAVGFGVKHAEQARAVAAIADAVVVGSTLVQTLEEAMPDAQKAVDNLCAKVQELAQGLAGK